MGRQFKNDGFGIKGVNAQASSLADALLSGKPLARSKPRRDPVPKLKPRPKPKFGRRDASDGGAHADGAYSRHAWRGWMFWISAMIAVGLGLQVWAGFVEYSASNPDTFVMIDGRPRLPRA